MNGKRPRLAAASRLLAAAVLAASAAGRAELVSERWGGKGKGLAHPGSVKVVPAAAITRLTFDLSALPKGAKVHHASLYCFTRGGRQPAQPVRLLAVDALAPDGRPSWSGKPLKLEAPWYRSFDATEAVRRWAADASKNLGLAVAQFDGFDAPRTFLEVRYLGRPGKLPPQVTALRAVHRDGQTFLVWKELPLFVPDPAKVFWIGKYEGVASKRESGPGEGFAGQPRVPAVTLKTLRDLKGLSVRGKKGPRSMQPIRVIKPLPEIRYRVYRSRRPITAAGIAEAEIVGETAPCCAYVERMLTIITHGEYYDPWEHPDSVIPTWSTAADKAVLPGEAFYVHTPADGGKFHYAVTVIRDGVENVSAFSAANSLAEPVAETPATPRPVLQYVAPNKRTRGGLEYHHAYWLAPPVANVPQADPLRVVVGVMEDLKEPAGLVVRTTAGGMFFGGGVTKGSVHLTIEQDLGYGMDLGYSQGRGTLRSFAESKVDSYSERYIMANVDWALAKWKIDRARITCQTSPHFAVRHGDVFRNLFLGPFQLDMDSKWNPHSGSLSGLFGPAGSARMIGGELAWDAVSIPWLLKRHPGRDIPFMACLFTQPKDGNHGAEYGWQDDPKGLAGLRDARQPYVAQWGGAGIGEVVDRLRRLRWDKSVPAFSRCSLDNNPGTGDPDAGDIWGQINGYLFWDYATITDEPGRWEMTVYLVPSSPEPACTVDLTPRQCRRFKPAKGQKLKWTNTSLADNKAASGTVTADRWGLVTLKGLKVTRTKNRIRIER